MPSLDEIKATIKSKIDSSNTDLKSSMSGSCLPPADKILDTLSKVNALTTTISDTIFSPETNNAATELNLQFEYQRAKNIEKNAKINLDVAEKGYFTVVKGEPAYTSLIQNRYTVTGQKELDELTSNFTNVNNLCSDLINMVTDQDIAVSNMNKVLQNLEDDNEKSEEIINGGNSDIHTYNRKSMYESKLKESVKNWTVIPSVIYWTLLILWVGIVMLYLRNLTLKTVGLLIGLVLYPYFSTNIILWILTKIQTVWNFIFLAVNNRVTT